MSLNISDFNFMGENCTPPPSPWKKVTLLFPNNLPLKVEVLSSPPLFENLVGGSTLHTVEGGRGCKLSEISRARQCLHLKKWYLLRTDPSFYFKINNTWVTHIIKWMLILTSIHRILQVICIFRSQLDLFLQIRRPFTQQISSGIL